MEEDEYSLLSSAADEANKQFIIEYAKNFQHKNALLAHNSSLASTTDQESSVVSEESSKEQSETQTQVATQPDTNTNNNEENHKKMLELVTNAPSRKIFIDTLVKQRDPSKDLFEIKLSPKNYERLQDILVKILKGILKKLNFGLFLMKNW